MKWNIIIFFLSICSFCYSQETNKEINCNRQSKNSELLTRIPEEICLPIGYGFNFVEELSDMNADGLKDIIIRWSKYPVNDGDTLFYSIYSQNKMGKYYLFKTFKNLMPIFLKNYDFATSPKADTILGLYHMNFPLRDLTFKNDIITLEFETERDIHIVNTYRYDTKRKDWFLVNQKEMNVGGAQYIILRSETPKPEQSIGQFNYFDYL